MKLSILFAPLLLAACAGVTTAAVQQAEVAAYSADQAQCVALAATRAAADACRASVKERWCGDGGALAEAGACSYVVDAGGGQ